MIKIWRLSRVAMEQAQPPLRKCARCKELLPVDNFHRRSDRKSGRVSYCRKCITELSRKPSRVASLAKWAKEHPENKKAAFSRWRKRFPEKERDYMLRRNYGITLKQFNKVIESQGGACAICGQRFSTSIVPCQDHDHGTGLHRGILCRLCNTLLGIAKERVDVLQSAITYLNTWSSIRGS